MNTDVNKIHHAPPDNEPPVSSQGKNSAGTTPALLTIIIAAFIGAVLVGMRVGDLWGALVLDIGPILVVLFVFAAAGKLGAGK